MTISILRKVDDAIIAAHHEAGHAVAGHILGARVGRIKIEGLQQSDSNLSWDGDASVDTSGLDGEKIAAIALAGPLAEIRIRALLDVTDKLDGSTDFGPPAPFIEAMKNVVNSKNSDSMYVRTTLSIGTQQHSLRTFLGNFVDDFIKAQSAVQNLEASLGRAAEITNNRQSWMIVSRLAMALIESRQQTVLRREVKEQRAHQLLSMPVEKN